MLLHGMKCISLLLLSTFQILVGSSHMKVDPSSSLIDGMFHCSVCNYDNSKVHINNTKYDLWNVYLPNVVAFNIPLSKYLTVTVVTLN